MSSDISNHDRAAWGETAIKAFAACTGQSTIADDPVSDPIADPGHDCDANRIDVLAAIRRGIGHWHAEFNGDPDDPVGFMPYVTVTIDEVAP